MSTAVSPGCYHREQKKEIERINMWQKLEELRKQYDFGKTTSPKK